MTSKSGGRRGHKQKAVNLGSHCNSTRSSYFTLQASVLRMIIRTFQSISHLKWRISSKFRTQRVAQNRRTNKSHIFHHWEERKSRREAKRNDRMCLVLWKLFKRHFLRKGGNVHPMSGREGKAGQPGWVSSMGPGTVTALEALITPSWAWPRRAGHHLWIFQSNSLLLLQEPKL